MTLKPREAAFDLSIWLRVLQEENHDTGTRELHGTLVQFGDGAQILKISLPADFSAVHLSMLPPGSSPSSVASLLAEMGFSVPVECVRVPPQGDATHCSADIRVEDPTFARRLCTKLDAKKLTSGVTFQITAVPINAPMPQVSNSSRVDCKKVHCSWHRPFRKVWLNFGNEDIAKKVNYRFNAGTYKVLGQQVSSIACNRSGGYHNPVVWTVCLTEVPATATEPDILCVISPHFRPRDVEMRQTSYKADLGTANAMIKSKLMQVGSLEWWEDGAESGGKRVKAKARFQDEEHARKAVTFLNNTPLPFNKNGKLTMQLVYSTKLKVSERIYKAVQAQIQTEKQVWKSQHLLFIPYEPTRGYRVLKIEGEDSKDVAQAKNSLEKILAGETVMCGDKPLWTPSFGINGDTYRRLKDVEQNLGVVIIRNKSQSRLYLYGPPEKCREARMLLADLAKEDASDRHAIDLDEQKFIWACHGGFKAISAALGKGVVAFDIISSPKRILVTGTDEQYKLALRMVADQKESEELGR
ncbi:hypothetical protein VTN00DRAFT_3300 [Thermoascus crustaceus]|uniref:uncharacterized protein n=1 Tax=Thermoascus crustaceus TaxID=5088 RepID=UPI00374328D8